MTAIASYLAGLALLDGLNPILLGLCALLAARRDRPAHALAFVAGIFASSFVGSIVMVFGLGTVISLAFERYEPAIRLLTVAMGVACILFGLMAPRLLARRSRRGLERDTLAGIFMLGAISNQTDLVTLTPFLAAMQLIMSSELGRAESFVLLIFYNGVLVLPLALLVVGVRLRGGAEASSVERLLGAIERGAPRIVQVLSIALGAAIVSYGILSA